MKEQKTFLSLFALIIAISGMMVFGVFPILAQESSEYDPTIHFYNQGMEIGVMGDNVSVGTLRSISPENKSNQSILTVQNFDNNIVQPQAVEAGSHFFPRGEKNIIETSDNVRWSCGEDAWTDFYYVPEQELWNNDIVVWSWNIINRTQINRNKDEYGNSKPGLYGGYYCVGGLCTISVCSTERGNPWDVYISYN